MAQRRNSQATSKKGSDRYVALLRGINVGGKNKLAMADLVGLFEEAGCADVLTYIQSGNVIFAATAGCAKRVAGLVSELIEQRFGLAVPVVLRSGEGMGKLVAANPFIEAGADPGKCHVMFLAKAPGKEDLAGLDAERSPGDAFAVRGQEVYLHLPGGAGRTKLTNAYFDARLKTVSTMRNWRTVLKLAELCVYAQGPDR